MTTREVAVSWRHPFGLLAIFAFSVVLGVGPKPAAEPQAPAKDTIKVQAAEVVVDAIVTDKHNRIVTNLSADDFTVYEDGVPQKLTSFRLYQGPDRKSTRLNSSHGYI